MPDEGPEEWYRNLPPITRGYFTASVASTILCQMGLLSIDLIHIVDPQAVFSRLELWRRNPYSISSPTAQHRHGTTASAAGGDGGGSVSGLRSAGRKKLPNL